LRKTLARAAHDAWRESKALQGIASRQSEWGEELMVPYEALSDKAKDLDRGTVRGVLKAIERAGFEVVPVGGSIFNRATRTML
jgi:RyR domain-containing protein